MRSLGSFLDGLLAKIEQLCMKRHGFDVPETRPVYCTIFFLSETLACFLSFAIHAREDVGVEISLVECDFTAADHRGNDTGKSFYTAHGANGILMFFGDGANLEREFGRGCQSVATRVHGRRAGVRFLSMESDDVTLDTFCAEHR